MKLDEIITNKEWTKDIEDEHEVVFSLDSFLNYLDQKISSSPNSRVLQQYKNSILSYFPNGKYEIQVEEEEKYQPLYEIIYSLVTSPLSDGTQYPWGLSFPISSHLIFATEALKKMMASITNKHLVGVEHFNANCALSETEVKEIILYAFLLKKIYKIEIFNTSTLVFQTNYLDVIKYYQVNINDQFVDIQYDGIFPEIDTQLIENDAISKESALSWLKKNIPINKIKLIGFSFLNLEDVTEKVEKEQLRTLLMTSNLGIVSQSKISQMVQKLVGCKSLDMLLLPILSMNDRIITEAWQPVLTNIENILNKYEINIAQFNEIIHQYISNPKLYFREKINFDEKERSFLSLFDGSRIMQSLIIKPIFSKEKLIGIIWISSDIPNVVTKQILIYIEESVPLIQNLFETTIGNYLNQIDKVIKSKFTSVQPSVEWKFNEVALQYLKDKLSEKHPTILPIKFRDIYPIYGAIDFRNSTIERNKAEVEDWIVQLEYLISTIQKIKSIVAIDILGEWKYKAQNWIRILQNGMDANQEFALHTFLEKESLMMLDELEQTDPNIHEIVQPYLAGIEPNGMFHKNSNELEKTFKILNTNIASLLDQMNDKLQEAYPTYFERYRTDGIEFNIYLGQSISPNKPFNKIFLKNAQLWQLNTMALIAQITKQSQDNLPRKIYTTQLIFVHSNTITVGFRLDERRFDVEGSYNIRYEVIKKRIDKAFIKGTSKRLTQPEKIAIVYFQKKDIEDYLGHIQYLQEKNILEEQMEELELEDMQGVSGLKAIRISIKKHFLLESESTPLLVDKNLGQKMKKNNNTKQK